jgi:hypothetical protein
MSDDVTPGARLWMFPGYSGEVPSSARARGADEGHRRGAIAQLCAIPNARMHGKL